MFVFFELGNLASTSDTAALILHAELLLGHEVGCVDLLAVGRPDLVGVGVGGLGDLALPSLSVGQDDLRSTLRRRYAGDVARVLEVVLTHLSRRHRASLRSWSADELFR